MKRYKPLFKLLEGKQQAIQILNNYFGDIGLELKYILELFEKFDPTSPKNKYFEVFAKIYVELSKKHRNENYLGLSNIFEEEMRDQVEKIESIEKRKLPINLSKIKTYDEFVKTLDDISSTITKSISKKGLSGLIKNKDYIEIPLTDPKKEKRAFIPLNYKASKVIASDRVGQCEGKWCTSYQKTEQYWQDYIYVNGGILVYIVNFENTKGFGSYRLDNLKQAIYFYNDKQNKEMFDAQDRTIRSTFFDYDVEKYVYKNWDDIREFIERGPHKPGIEIPDVVYFNYGIHGDDPYFHSYEETLKLLIGFLLLGSIYADPHSDGQMMAEKEKTNVRDLKYVSMEIWIKTERYKREMSTIQMTDEHGHFDEKIYKLPAENKMVLNINLDVLKVYINNIYKKDLAKSCRPELNHMGSKVVWF